MTALIRIHVQHAKHYQSFPASNHESCISGYPPRRSASRIRTPCLSTSHAHLKCLGFRECHGSITCGAPYLRQLILWPSISATFRPARVHKDYTLQGLVMLRFQGTDRTIDQNNNSFNLLVTIISGPGDPPEVEHPCNRYPQPRYQPQPTLRL
ncbi:hypothetical protein NEOLEDRAFT_959 [Neolentinus lepideus HHB14362 ss-1]|uniref:Uncharacterized protein n=1 Tax=Neolentinus lepideus HHB14362 ss-1 TaxID=1314782 RepID=A0A165VXC7_9AGAM|nr:hypothetical protein NEOLEDRAFT_959 [Neolentinus lepideus HHB14362 ss-1]